MRGFFWKILLTVHIMMALGLQGGCNNLGDDLPPAAPAGFTYDPITRRYEWTSAGDDGGTGISLTTDIRFSDHDVTSHGGLSHSFFAGLPLINNQFNEETPRSPGMPDYFVGTRSDSLQYLQHFLEVRDEVGNASLPVAAGSAAPTNPAQVRLLHPTVDVAASGTGAVNVQGDINGDGIADLVAVYTDATTTDRDLVVYLGRPRRGYYINDFDLPDTADPMTGAVAPDPSANEAGDCGDDILLRFRSCLPDILLNVAALGTSVGGSADLLIRPRSLSVADLTGDGRAEILAGAPLFQPAGEASPRGAAFVFSFPETLVSTRAGRESFFYMRSPFRAQEERNYVGIVTSAGPQGVTVNDVQSMPHAYDDDYGTGSTVTDDGINLASGAHFAQSWSVYAGEPLRIYRASGAVTCPGTSLCTGDDLTVSAGGITLTSASINFRGLSEEKYLLVILDGTTGDPVAAVPVYGFGETQAGFANRILIQPDQVFPSASTLPTGSGVSFALYPEVASGTELVTTYTSGTTSDPLPIGNLRSQYDPGNPLTVRTIVDPTDPGASVDPSIGEELPFAAILGPEADSEFGQAVSAEGDMNLDGNGDIAVGAPGLDSLPARLGTFASMADRGGAFVLFGSPYLSSGDVPAPGGVPDSVYDLGPAGSDRANQMVLGRADGDRTGASVAATRNRADNAGTSMRDERSFVAEGISSSSSSTNIGRGVTLAIGAPEASPGGRSSAGAIYLFRPHTYFESRDPLYPGELPDGIWELAGDWTDLPDATTYDIAESEIWGEAAGDELGASLSLSGDLNGDHVFDLVAGAPGAGTSDDGRIYVFLGSLGEVTPLAFTQMLANERTVLMREPGALSSSDYFTFFQRGNVDYNRVVDTDRDGILEAYEDRCLYCVYDLAGTFPFPATDSYATGPDVIVEGGANTGIGDDVGVGYFNTDPYEDVILTIQGGLGSWVGVLNGLTTTMIPYRDSRVGHPLERPATSNFVDTGTAGSFVAVPGNSTGAVSWWVETQTIPMISQVFVSAEQIYAGTSSGTTGDPRVFGRGLTDEITQGAPGDPGTAEFSFLYRVTPEDTVRWNVLTAGGLFSPTAVPATTPFAGTIEALSSGGDANGDGAGDLLFFVEGGELRFAH